MSTHLLHSESCYLVQVECTSLSKHLSLGNFIFDGVIIIMSYLSLTEQSFTSIAQIEEKFFFAE